MIADQQPSFGPNHLEDLILPHLEVFTSLDPAQGTPCLLAELIGVLEVVAKRKVQATATV